MARRSPARSNRRSQTHPVHQPAPRRAGDQLVDDHHHRDVQGGAARAAVFGVSDGLVSNVSLILGVAGAFSMAAGEYVSMRAQTELLERELELERREIRRRPENERRELAAIYRSRGVDASMADELATELMRDPEMALETHAREELGIDPGSLGSPMGASMSSFLAFCVGGVIPLMPWFFTKGSSAVVLSVAFGAIAAIIVGALLAQFTGRSPLR